MLGARATEVLQGALECAERSESSSRVDSAALRRRRSGAGTDTSRSPDAASAGVGTDPGSDPRVFGQTVRRSLPKSALGKAITYARNQWNALRRYTSDGRLTIDNNVSERTLRLQAIGRKNWEFLGSAAAGPRASTLFTILAGAKRHHLEPWVYVRDVIQRMCAGESDLEALLPDR